MKLRKVIALTALLFACPFAFCADFVIYHTSDIHGYFFPRETAQGPKGGFAVLSAFVSKEESPFMLVDSGDWGSGKKESNDSGGMLAIEFMNSVGKSAKNINKAGYSVMTIGNHDSDFGDKTLAKDVEAFKGEAVSINVYDKSIVKKDYVIFKNGKKKIAVIGFSAQGPGAQQGARVKDMKEVDFDGIMKAVLSEEPDLVVILSHDSVADARKPSALLDTLKNSKYLNKIDLVLGGHAHKKINSQILGEEGPLFVEDGEYLAGVGRVEVTFAKDKEGKNKLEAKYIELYQNEIGSDEKIAKKVNAVENISLRKEVAFVPQTITKYPAKGDCESPSAHIMATRAYDALKKQDKGLDFALFSVPSVRNDIKEGVFKGSDMDALFPYQEYFSAVTIDGKLLKKAVEKSLKCEGESDCYSIYGYSDNVVLEYVVDTDNTSAVKRFLINGKPFDENRSYRIALLSHLPRGHFEGSVFVEEGVAPIYGPLPQSYKEHMYDLSPFMVFESYVSSSPEGENGLKTLLGPQNSSIKYLKQTQEAAAKTAPAEVSGQMVPAFAQ